MISSWYVVYVRQLDKEGNPTKLPPFPMVGTTIVHYLGRSDDAGQMLKDKEDPFWPKIQDGVRPAWAPDFLRQGYSVFVPRKGLPQLALKMGIRNPQKLKEETGGLQRIKPNGSRLLTFDDVWVVGVRPKKSPMYMPPLEKEPEDWWLSTTDEPSTTSTYICAGGSEVEVGAQRLADVVASMLQTASGFHSIPHEDREGFEEFISPLVPIHVTVPDSPAPVDYPMYDDERTAYRPQGIELYRGS